MKRDKVKRKYEKSFRIIKHDIFGNFCSDFMFLVVMVCKGHRRRAIFIARDENFYLLPEIAYVRTRAIFVARDLSVIYALLEKKISKHRTRAIFVARDKKLLSIVVNIKHV